MVRPLLAGNRLVLRRVAGHCWGRPVILTLLDR